MWGSRSFVFVSRTGGAFFSSGFAFFFLFFPVASVHEVIDVECEDLNGVLEGVDAASDAALDDGALDQAEDERGEPGVVGVAREIVAHILQTLFDGGAPVAETLVEGPEQERLVEGNRESEFAGRTAAGEIGVEEILAIVAHDADDAHEWMVHDFVGGLDDAGLEGGGVVTDYGEEELLLGFEEVVEATGVGLGFGEDVVDGGGGVPAEPEELAGGFDDAGAGGLTRCGHGGAS